MHTHTRMDFCRRLVCSVLLLLIQHIVYVGLTIESKVREKSIRRILSPAEIKTVKTLIIIMHDRPIRGGGTTASNAHWAFVSWEWSIHVNAHRRRTKKTSSIGVYAHFRLDACYSYLFYFQSFFFRKLMCSNVVFFVFHLVFNEHFAKLWDISANGNEMSKWTN